MPASASAVATRYAAVAMSPANQKHALYHHVRLHTGKLSKQALIPKLGHYLMRINLRANPISSILKPRGVAQYHVFDMDTP